MWLWLYRGCALYVCTYVHRYMNMYYSCMYVCSLGLYTAPTRSLARIFITLS